MLSTGPPNVPRILTKEDYLTLFHATGIQSSGALWGVYKWAINLGEARFNFEMDPEENNFSFLDACD